MDALFVVVAELLVVPLVLWALIGVELTLGVVASIVGVLLGRRSLTEALDHRWRSIRRRLRWSLIFMSAGLLLADLVFFDALVGLALSSVDDRDDLDVQYRSAEGSFILGRIEIDGLLLRGRRGDAESPRASFELTFDELVIDIDTAKLLALDFAVEEIAVDGARGRWDRLRAGKPDEEQPGRQTGFRLEREFAVDRMHFGDLVMELRDHTRLGEDGQPRAVALELAELDLGPLHSDSAAFDLLYRARGRGAVAGLPFELTAIEVDGRQQSTLEVHDLPLDALSDTLERRAGIRTGGRADLTVVDRYRPGDASDSGEAEVELAVSLQLRALELSVGEGASMTTKMMLGAAADTLTELGADFPLRFAVTIRADELAGMRSFAESGVIERVVDAIGQALRDELRARARPGGRDDESPTP